MTSFIELPRLAFDGRELSSLFVNTADIVLFEGLWDGQTRVEISGLGADNSTVTVKTYVPLGALINALGDLVNPSVLSWSADTRQAWSVPLAATLKDAAERERSIR